MTTDGCNGCVALVVGVLLIVIEAHVPTYGALGVAGTLLAGTGAWLLFTSGGLGLEIALPVTLGVGGRRTRCCCRHRSEGAERAARTRADRRAVPRRIRGAGPQLGRPPGAGGAGRRIVAGPNGVRLHRDAGHGESVVVEGVRGLTLSVRRREPWELPC